MADSEKFLKTAMKIAANGKGLVSPNPMVGAVIARGKRILAQGYHRAFGMPHAEIEALKKAGGKAKGATMYVNMEPCCHYGKTPPCTAAIIDAGIKEVVCSMEDPNPLVCGKGFEELEGMGIKVRKGSLYAQAEELNRAYIVNTAKKRPYVILKWAQTLDGKTAVYRGDSKWITNELSREYARKLRFEADGVIVGANTVLNDNPALDYAFPSFYPAKMEGKKRYWKIILDPGLKTPAGGNIWKNPRAGVLIITGGTVSKSEIARFGGKAKCEVVPLKTRQGAFDIQDLLRALYERDIGIVMVEGGSKTLTGFWESSAADEVIIFCGGKILGGSRSIPSLAGRDKETISAAVNLDIKEIKMFQQDIMIRGRPCFQE